MSLPARCPRTSPRLSSAAARPTSGLAPAPSPRVTVAPSWTWYPARQAASAWASVLQATSSTPSRPAATMVSIALPPAPPTPTTVMRGLVPVAVARSIVMRAPPASARIIARTGMLGGHTTPPPGLGQVAVEAVPAALRAVDVAVDRLVADRRPAIRLVVLQPAGDLLRRPAGL